MYDLLNAENKRKNFSNFWSLESKKNYRQRAFEEKGGSEG